MSKNPVIDDIKGKITLLIADNKRLRKDRDRLSQKNEKLMSENTGLAEKNALLERRLQILELKEAVSGGTEKSKVAQARINRLMREVDKCIALLNR